MSLFFHVQNKKYVVNSSCRETRSSSHPSPVRQDEWCCIHLCYDHSCLPQFYRSIITCIFRCLLNHVIHFKALYRPAFRRHRNVSLTPDFLCPVIYGRVASTHVVCQSLLLCTRVSCTRLSTPLVYLLDYDSYATNMQRLSIDSSHSMIRKII